MAGNKTGSLFSIMTFGESHGPFIGVVIDGIKPGLPIDEEEIQKEMNRRRPGQSDLTTPRKEKDRIQIVSGVFEGQTTGTPICLLIKNKDQRSSDYDKLKDVFRPGHAGYTYLKKYGIFDYRGGGRASGRETAARVASGAIAKQILKSYGIEFRAFVRQVGPHEAKQVNYDFIEQNPARCCDPDIAPLIEQYIKQIAGEGDSIGGIVELHITGLPPGLGDPVFEKLDAEMARALMSIGAVKGIEFGNGFKVANLRGSENNDLFHADKNDDVKPQTNHSGGVLGGISTGQDVVLRLAVKPPSSIQKEQKTVDKSGREFSLSIEGRHDPCICPRVVPVAEAMAAIVILDLLLVQQALSSPEKASERRQREIEFIDTQLLLLLKKRLEITASKNYKKRVTDHQPHNNKETPYLYSQLEHFAAELDLSSSFVAAIWKEIMEESQ